VASKKSPKAQVPAAKVHTTNYRNTLIAVAEDCPVSTGVVPTGDGTTAALLFAWISKEPYVHSSDDLLFRVFAERACLPQAKLAEARMQFFSKGQACLRAGALSKRYGWGVHFDAQQRVAMFAVDTPTYKQLAKTCTVKLAMRSRKG
jgi:Family of unknown function (DUF6157)